VKNTASEAAKLPKFLAQLPTRRIDTRPEHPAPERQQRKSRFFPIPEVEEVDGKSIAFSSYKHIEKLDTDNTRTISNAGMSHIIEKDEDTSSSTVETNHAQDFHTNINHVDYGGPNTTLKTPISALNPAAPEFMSNVDNDAFASTLENLSISTSDIGYAQSFHAGLNQLSNYSPSTFIPAPSMFNMYDTERAQFKGFFLKMEQQWFKQKQLFEERMKNWASSTNYDVNVQTALNTINVVLNYLRSKDPHNPYLQLRRYDHGNSAR